MSYRIHIALNVADIARSVDFYSRLLGAEPDKRTNGFAKFETAEPNLNLALSQTNANALPAPKDGALNHLGLQVRDAEDVRAAERKLIAAGLEPVRGFSLSGEERILLYDPDGNEWEVFYATTKAAHPNRPEASAGQGEE